MPLTQNIFTINPTFLYLRLRSGNPLQPRLEHGNFQVVISVRVEMMRHGVADTPIAIVEQGQVEAEHSPIVLLVEVVVGDDELPEQEQTRQQCEVNIVVFDS